MKVSLNTHSKFTKSSRSIHILLVSVIIILLGGGYYLYPESPLPKDAVIDQIIVDKSEHHMDVYQGGKLLKQYQVSLGRGTWGLKSKNLDNITPTGDFVIDSKFTNSNFHKALTISYGNQIEIHGIRNDLGFIGKFHRFIDWTKGCIAVTDTEIDELYEAVPIGTEIQIRE